MTSSNTEGLAPLDAGAPAVDAGNKGGVSTDPAIGGMDVSSSSRRPKVSSNTMLVVGVVVVAAGVLWGMRFVGMGAGSALASPANAKELESFALKPSVDHQKVLADLQATRTALQVNEQDVKKNPFRLTGGEAPAIDTSTLDAQRSAEALRQEEERRRRERADYLTKIEGLKSSIKLNGVILGSVPAARINNRVVRQGDLVQGMFTLAKVHDRAIELEFEGRMFRVEMSGGEGLEGNGNLSPEAPAPSLPEPNEPPLPASNPGPNVPPGPRNGGPARGGNNR
ncbi:MAG: hypothetical protein ACT4PL_05765 [Phycisphaerales bacterium]